MLTDFPASHALIEIRRDPRKAALDTILINIEQACLDAGHSQNLRHAVAHGPCSDNSCGLD
jgi:hypothetical protein